MVLRWALTRLFISDLNKEMRESIPMLRGRVLDEKITVPLERAVKAELVELKLQKGVDVLEWIRGLIRRELPRLKEDVA